MGKVKTVKMRKFKVVQEISMELEISQDLLDAVLTDDWRKDFYKLETPNDVAEHLAWNLVQGRNLSSLDGFANQPEGEVRVLMVEGVDYPTTKEIK